MTNTPKPDDWAIYKSLTDDYMYGKLMTVGDNHCRISVDGDSGRLIDRCTILAAGSHSQIKVTWGKLVASRKIKQEECNLAVQQMFKREAEILAASGVGLNGDVG